MKANERLFVGIDGEGVGRNPHKYILLAASDASGLEQWSAENTNGLSSYECLEFLTDLAYENPNVIGFSYAFKYDMTKILQDLPNPVIYRIMRPDTRKWDTITTGGKISRQPSEQVWGPFCINYFGSRYSIRRGRRNGVKSDERGLVIWDVFKFFQGAFVKALEDWKVGIHDLEFIKQMKAARGEFSESQFENIKTYCFQECRYLAQLVRKLTDAHEMAGLKLKNYHGAGSTASAVLDTMGIKELIKQEIQYSKERPDYSFNGHTVSMQSAVKRAFFGGRFENSVVGPLEHDIYNYDISSAYPYQITQLPCLEHGLWRWTYERKDIDSARQALIFWANYSHVNNQLWGPLPFRYKGGTIIFPVTGGCGFTYKHEFLEAEHFGVGFGGAWLLDQDCDCQPFKDIPEYYNERCRIGKEGPGIVLKLGVNAVYGKLAQSIGEPIYRSLLWAGMVTSGCRAQLLQAMRCHKDMNSLFALATDGLYSLEKLELPKPIDTGTEGYGKPLGGWEEKIIEGGMFFGRPGVNFAIRRPKDAKLVRGRGYGRGIIVTYSQDIIQSFLDGKDEHVFPDVIRFAGAKTSVSETFNRSEHYGEWVEQPMRMSFSPRPKRAKRVGNRLLPWKLIGPLCSAEYQPENIEDGYNEAVKDVLEEQPR